MSALTIPVRDPWTAARQLVDVAFGTLAGAAANGALAILTRVAVGGVVRLLKARSADEARTLIRAARRRGRVVATLGHPLVLRWASMQRPVPRRREWQDFYDWWTLELERSSAPEELKAVADVAIYSVLRTSVRMTTRRPRDVAFTRAMLARGLASVEVCVAALLAVLAHDRSPGMGVPVDVLEELVEHLSADADAYARFCAEVTFPDDDLERDPPEAPPEPPHQASGPSP